MEFDQNQPWKGDPLSREKFAGQLTRIVQTTTAPSVISVSAGYGMGKTYFAKRWVAELRMGGKLAVYFNAWETDYARDPLIAFVDALKGGIEASGIKLSKSKPLARKAKAMAVVAGKIAAKSLIRAATFGAVGEKIESEVEAALAGGLDQIEKLAEARLESFTQEKRERRKFKEELSNYRDALLKASVSQLALTQNSSGNTESNAQDTKLYVVIDELDRCRASYAVALLEDIKHLFDAEGYIFVIFADENALQSAAAKTFLITHNPQPTSAGDTALASFAGRPSRGGVSWREDHSGG